MKFVRVLVYDDEPEIAGGLANDIQSACGSAIVTPAGKADFQDLMDLINQRRAGWRSGGNRASVADPHPADDADVIVVDYDLLGYSETADTTGSRLAYLLRCFLKCGFIIILNKDRMRNPFELKLGSPTDDFADLHVGSAQIGNPGLWQAPLEGFRPWYWPLIPNATENFKQCVIDVQQNPDAPILSFLGLDHVIDWIPRRAHDFLAGGRRVEHVTFEDFTKFSNSGIDPKDELIAGQVARVAAARIVTLLNSIILPEQSVLVDAPHLVSRFPSLIKSVRDAIGTWNSLCNPVDDRIDDLLAEVSREYRFPQSHWLWRPAWYWPDINKDEGIEEVNDPWAAEQVDWVFCEDISQFVPIDIAQDFRALVSPPFIKRFMLKKDSPAAHCYVRQIGQGGPLDPLRADYVPEAALSM